MISDKNSPKNLTIYVADENMGCCILAIKEGAEPSVDSEETSPLPNNNVSKSKLCQLYFNGAASREGAGAGFILIPP